MSKFIYTVWKHNEGFTSRWLRRVTYTTKRYLCCDVQPVLLLCGKWERLYKENLVDYHYGFKRRFAKKFRQNDNGQIVRQTTYLDNTDGSNTVTVVQDFSQLKSAVPYDKMFNVDIRDVLPTDSKFLDRYSRSFDIWSDLLEGDRLIKFENRFFKLTTEKVCEDDCLDGLIITHLKKLFNLPVHRINETYIKIDTIGDNTVYSQSATHYHINNASDDVRIIDFSSNRENVTISFWLFDDLVVFRREDGIDTW